MTKQKQKRNKKETKKKQKRNKKVVRVGIILFNQKH